MVSLEQSYDRHIAKRQQGMELMYREETTLREWLQKRLQSIGLGPKQAELPAQTSEVSERGLAEFITLVTRGSVRNLCVSIDGTNVTVTGETSEYETTKTAEHAIRRYIGHSGMAVNNQINITAAGG